MSDCFKQKKQKTKKEEMLLFKMALGTRYQTPNQVLVPPLLDIKRTNTTLTAPEKVGVVCAAR